MLTRTVIHLRRYDRFKTAQRVSYSPARPTASLSSSIAHVRGIPQPDTLWDASQSSPPRFVLRENTVPNNKIPLETFKDFVRTVDRGTVTPSFLDNIPYRESKRELQDPEQLRDRQERIEGEQISQAVEEYAKIFKELVQFGRASGMKVVQRLLLQLYEPFAKALLNEINLVQTGTFGNDRSVYGPFLLLIPPEKLAVITIDTVIKYIMRVNNLGTPVTALAMGIAELVETEFNLWRVKALEASNPDLTLSTFQKRLVRQPGKGLRRLGSFNFKLRQITKDAGWIKADKAKLGCILIHLLTTSTTTSSGEPAFGITKPIRLMRSTALLTMHPSLFENVRHHEDQHPRISPRYLPMLVPPEPWRGDRFFGAYFFHKAPLMKITGSYQEVAVRKGDLPRVLDGLNYLGTVPWVVDQTVFQIAWNAFHRGDQTLAEIPSGQPLPLPSPLSYMRTRAEIQKRRADRKAIFEKANVLKDSGKRASAAPKPAQAPDGLLETEPSFAMQQDILATQVLTAEKESTQEAPVDLGDPNELILDEFLYRELCNRVTKKNYEVHSIRCDLKIRLGIAKKFLHDELFFPHHLDFRGRAYPVPPNLSHLGSDLNRGILRFSRAKPLGPKGFRWLKIHLANLFGNNKICMDDRERWADSHMADIMDSARNPESGGRWWQSAENPFQALSACKEIAAAFESGDPASFLSNLPVHQDGSCNGLQHYAALGLDELGGRAVNLMPAELPQDVYSRVLEGVIEQVQEDATISPDDINPTRKEKGELARMLVGIVDRKVIKQTVMTSVYGVTIIGARAQIQNRLEERFAQDRIKMTYELEKQLYRASLYLGNVTLTSLTKLFKRAKEIMDWLGAIAAIVAKQNQAMSWVTPLGLPVTQPYRKAARQMVKTVTLNVTLAIHEEYLPVSARKQRSAFPPNFVHSLDASHMLLTSIRMRDAGLTFAAVHDSFWTHASDVDELNRHLRDSFVELYEFPVLEDLLDSLQVRYPHLTFPPVPSRGNLSLRSVRDSTYFFH